MNADKLAQESNEMLLRIFASNIGFDYIEHHKKNTAQFHPDFSEDTVQLWKEIESRLAQPECLNFDVEKAMDMLKEEIDKQYGIIQQREVATLSYHAGIESGLRLAKEIIRKCIKREAQDDAET